MVDEAPLGRKGQETRRRLMDTAAKLLDHIPLREIRAADISRKAGLSTGAFYVYFENVEAIALALAHRVTEEAHILFELLESDWRPPYATAAIRKFVRAYFRFWDDHRAVLRVRNLAADEGDQRFLDARLKMQARLHRMIAEKVALGRARGYVHSAEHDTAIAAMAIGSIDRVASFYSFVDMSEYGVTREQLLSAGVHLIKMLTVGQDAM